MKVTTNNKKTVKGWMKANKITTTMVDGCDFYIDYCGLVITVEKNGSFTVASACKPSTMSAVNGGIEVLDAVIPAYNEAKAKAVAIYGE